MIAQLTPAWHQARKGRVTGSMVGAILGLSPYMTRQDAMRSMVRASKGATPEFTGNIATDWGTRNEPQARIDYEMDTLHDVQDAPFVTYEDWLGASPDGLVGAEGGVEFKCPYGLRKDPAPVPFKALADQPHYYAQVQIELLVTGRKWWHFYQWAPMGQRLEITHPDQDWLNENLPRLRQFYAEFLHELAENADEHLNPLRVTIDTPEAHKMAAEWDQLSDAIANAEERKKELLAEMATMAGERDATFAGRKLTNVQKAGAVSYAKAIKALLPKADLAPYTGKPSSYWKLT